MISLILAMLVNLVPAQPAPSCETYGPRVDGIRVTVCDGRVVSMEDAAGNVLVYPTTGGK